MIVHQKKTTTIKNNLFYKKTIFILSIITLSYISTISVGLKPSFFNIIFLVVTFVMLHKNKITFFIFLFLVSLAISYSPSGMMYGEPSNMIVSAIMFGDKTEALSFIKSLSAKEITVITLSIILIFNHFILFKNYNIKKAPFVLLLSLLITISIIYSDRVINSTYPASFIVNTKKSINELMETTDKLKSPDLWNNISAAPKYKNYILVIGESARMDYHSAYGYNQDTSPFMRTTNGKIHNGLISPAPATSPSLSRMLTLSNDIDSPDAANFSYDIISLVKKSGIHTSWVSNQNIIDVEGSPASIIALKSDNSYFRNIKNDGDMSPPDIVVLDKFIKIFNKESTRPGVNLFVFHLYGSHNDPCDRIFHNDINLKHKNGETSTCYLSSIKQTDEILKKIKEIADKSGESYSILYFSDHGVSHHGAGFRHNVSDKEDYQVPLIQISSDSSKREETNALKTGFKMTNYIANWLGISADGIEQDYDLFNNTPDEKIRVWAYGEMSFTDYDTLNDDPAI
ncbi:phosphoethanolamine transferase [Morganella morganii]|uniref:phosphoethanolamine transferase n=1 Tax=Morganella morganii TaxID=582 RepID=UPI0037516673